MIMMVLLSFLIVLGAHSAEIVRPGEPSTGEAVCSASADWGVSGSRDFMLKCPDEDQPIVRRREVSEAECRKDPMERRRSADPTGWDACPPREPPCTDEQFPGWRRQVKAAANLHVQIHRARCLAPAKTEAEIEALRNQLRAMPVPSCMPPLDDEPTSIVVHHTAFPQSAGPEEIQYAHMFVMNKWSDCGYHYMIAPDTSGQWRIYECRSSFPKDGKRHLLTGAHVGPGLNSGSIGVVISGNYAGADSGDFPGVAPGAPTPPPGAIAALMALTKKLRAEYPSIKKVQSHREAKASGIGCGANCSADCGTECPGEGCMHLPALLEKRYVR